MGIVYRAEDTRLGREVAIKFMPPRLSHNAQALERFRREARATSALNHLGICTIHDLGAGEDGRQFIVMELLEGEMLQQRLAAAQGRSALPCGEVLELGIQIADALEAAHAKGVIHRDLKPANLFITRRGQAKILDFGLAKILAPDADQLGEQPTAALEVTSPGLAMGTIAYMSPEQALGRELDARTDIFSFGVVLYEMATGKAAFPGATSAAVFDGILNRVPLAPTHINAECPAGLEPILNTALEKDPALRYQSAAELRGALKRLRRDTESGGVAAVADAVESGEHFKRDGALGARGGGRARAAGWLGAALLALGLGGGYAWHRHRAPLMSGKGRVALADFSNTTGDPMFDGALRQALAVQLEQSPFLNVVNDQEMAQTAQLMGLPTGAPVRAAAARQLCQRVSGAASLEGSIAQIGTTYSLILEAVNCSTGDTLASAEQIAQGKDQVLPALGRLASDLRSKLGESLASMRQYDTPILEATTPSLAALKAYTVGRQALGAGDYPTAESDLRAALGIDPQFAMAWATLGTVVADVHGNNDLAAPDWEKAYALRDRVSPPERFYITTRYDDGVLEDEQQALAEYRLWEQTYPNDPLPYGNACVQEYFLGRFGAALADCLAAAQRDPGSGIVRANVVLAYWYAGQPEKARSLVDRDLARTPNSPLLRQAAFELALHSQNAGRADQELQAIAARPDGADLARQLREERMMYGGQARALRATVEAGGNDPDEAGLLGMSDAAWDLPGPAREAAAQLLRGGLPATGQTALSAALEIYALTGDAARAAPLSAELNRRYPHSTYTQFIDLPAARAGLALAGRDAAGALAALAPGQAYELGVYGNAIPAYLRGQALLAQHQAQAAAGVFQAAAAAGEYGVEGLAQLGLARAQAMAGNAAAARASYERLFAMWKDADPDLPPLAAAKKEYQRFAAAH